MLPGALDEVANLATPDTLLAWYRNLIARKWTYARKGPDRPCVSQAISGLVVRMARENASWGYDRLQGALANLGHTVSSSTVANILKRHGIEPAPERAERFVRSIKSECLERMIRLPAPGLSRAVRPCVIAFP